MESSNTYKSDVKQAVLDFETSIEREIERYMDKVSPGWGSEFEAYKSALLDYLVAELDCSTINDSNVDDVKNEVLKHYKIVIFTTLNTE